MSKNSYDDWYWVYLRYPLEKKKLLLKEGNDEERERAAYALYPHKDDKSVVLLLLDSLKDENPNVRANAIFTLTRFQDRQAFDLIIAALWDDDAWVRAVAAINISKYMDTSVVPELLEALKDSDALVREYAVRSLGYLDDKTTRLYIWTMLNDKVFGVRDAARNALLRFKQQKDEQGRIINSEENS